MRWSCRRGSRRGYKVNVYIPTCHYCCCFIFFGTANKKFLMAIEAIKKFSRINVPPIMIERLQVSPFWTFKWIFEGPTESTGMYSKYWKLKHLAGHWYSQYGHCHIPVLGEVLLRFYRLFWDFVYLKSRWRVVMSACISTHKVEARVWGWALPKKLEIASEVVFVPKCY